MILLPAATAGSSSGELRRRELAFGDQQHLLYHGGRVGDLLESFRRVRAQPQRPRTATPPRWSFAGAASGHAGTDRSVRLFTFKRQYGRATAPAADARESYEDALARVAARSPFLLPYLTTGYCNHRETTRAPPLPTPRYPQSIGRRRKKRGTATSTWPATAPLTVHFTYAQFRPGLWTSHNSIDCCATNDPKIDLKCLGLPLRFNWILHARCTCIIGAIPVGPHAECNLQHSSSSRIESELYLREGRLGWHRQTTLSSRSRRLGRSFHKVLYVRLIVTGLRYWTVQFNTIEDSADGSRIRISSRPPIQHTNKIAVCMPTPYRWSSASRG